jgi:hypothetical protein
MISVTALFSPSRATSQLSRLRAVQAAPSFRSTCWSSRRMRRLPLGVWDVWGVGRRRVSLQLGIGQPSCSTLLAPTSAEVTR